MRNPAQNWYFCPKFLAHLQGIQRSIGNYASNYQLMDEESTRGMVIPLGIASSWMRNPPKEWLFAGNRQLMDEKSTKGMVIPLGIGSSWMRNPPEEWLSAGNRQLMDEESNKGNVNRWESPVHG
jgi:hypothetical protein